MPHARYYPPIFAASVSIFGLLIVLMLAINPPTIYENFFWRKPLIGSIFSLICILGIFAALFPKRCSQAFHFRKDNTHLNSHRINATSHHPDCGKFSAHVTHVGSYTLCAACAGLLFGAIAALVGTTFYFFSGWSVQAGFPITMIGAVGIILGFLQLKFRSFIRLIINMFFVLGAFLVLTGIDELTESLFVDFFSVALIVFWILTRIQLSQWDHWRICRNCESQCEVWEAKKNRD
jgi:hypothetical protein